MYHAPPPTPAERDPEERLTRQMHLISLIMGVLALAMAIPVYLGAPVGANPFPFSRIRNLLVVLGMPISGVGGLLPRRYQRLRRWLLTVGYGVTCLGLALMLWGALSA